MKIALLASQLHILFLVIIILVVTTNSSISYAGAGACSSQTDYPQNHYSAGGRMDRAGSSASCTHCGDTSCCQLYGSAGWADFYSHCYGGIVMTPHVCSSDPYIYTTTGDSESYQRQDVTVQLYQCNNTFWYTYDCNDCGASDEVRVSGLNDMSETWSGSGDSSDNDNVCIYRSGGSSYDIRVEGTTDSGNYVLINGANKIPITVYWNDVTGTTGKKTLDSADNPSLSGETGANTSSDTCSGGTNANISWNVSEADMQAKPAGAYSITLTNTVSIP